MNRRTDNINHPNNSIYIFYFIALFTIITTCSGCISYKAAKFCERSNKNILILERRGEFSKDGKNLIVYLKKRTEYWRDPFKIWHGSYEDESTHVYPLTNPEPQSILKEFLVIADSNELQHIQVLNYEKNNNKKRISKSSIKANALLLPSLYIYPKLQEDSDVNYSTIRVHPADLKYLSGPFVWTSFERYGNNTFVVPYKLENNICYTYIPHEDLIGQKEIHGKPNMGSLVSKVILLPPAFLLDVITSPFQAIYFMYFAPQIDWNALQKTNG